MRLGYFSESEEGVAELNRRGFFKGLFGLAIVAAVGKPEVVKASPVKEDIASAMKEQARVQRELLLDLATYGTVAFELKPGRLNRFKGEILKHAVPSELLMVNGSKIQFSETTYVARRYIPYGKRQS